MSQAVKRLLPTAATRVRSRKNEKKAYLNDDRFIALW
jgi:hypothetical protein